MDSARPNILVVDDDCDIRQTIADFLCDVGRHVTTAIDGLDAWEKLGALEHPCLVLLDLMMPRMSGIEFLDHLAASPYASDVAVLVMSADDRLRREAARYASVHGTLRKPFEIDRLLSIIEDWHSANPSRERCLSPAPAERLSVRPGGAFLPGLPDSSP